MCVNRIFKDLQEFQSFRERGKPFRVGRSRVGPLDKIRILCQNAYVIQIAHLAQFGFLKSAFFEELIPQTSWKGNVFNGQEDKNAVEWSVPERMPAEIDAESEAGT